MYPYKITEAKKYLPGPRRTHRTPSGQGRDIAPYIRRWSNTPPHPKTPKTPKTPKKIKFGKPYSRTKRRNKRSGSLPKKKRGSRR